MVICVERGANDLHMVHLMPLPPIISCSSKIQNGLPFWCRPTQIVLEKRPLNGCSSSSSSTSFSGHFPGECGLAGSSISFLPTLVPDENLGHNWRSFFYGPRSLTRKGTWPIEEPPTIMSEGSHVLFLVTQTTASRQLKSTDHNHQHTSTASSFFIHHRTPEGRRAMLSLCWLSDTSTLYFTMFATKC